MEHNKKKIGLILYLLVALVVIGAGSAIAYFTSIPATRTNTITFGNVSINLTETNFPTTQVQVEPNQTIAKNPQITNLQSDAYVFLKVTVPKRNIRVVNTDQSVAPSAVTQLFSYTVNSGWTLISTDTSNANNNVYVYAYTAGSLAKNATTTALFNNVKYANVYEGDVTDTSVNIVVDALAIQSSETNFTGSNLTEQLTNAYNTYLKG